MHRPRESAQPPQPPAPRSPLGSVRTVDSKVARGCLTDRGSCRARRCQALGHGKMVLSDLQSESRSPTQIPEEADDVDYEPAQYGQEIRRQSPQAIHGDEVFWDEIGARGARDWEGIHVIPATRRFERSEKQEKVASVRCRGLVCYPCSTD